MLTDINLYGNSKITDESVNMLLRTIGYKCHRLKSLCLNWTSISNQTCKHLSLFYQSNPWHSLNKVYLCENKNINNHGIKVLHKFCVCVFF